MCAHRARRWLLRRRHRRRRRWLTCVDLTCDIFLCDDSDCPTPCRVVTGRDQVVFRADAGIVYGNVQDANGEDFETDFTAGQTPR